MIEYTFVCDRCKHRHVQSSTMPSYKVLSCKLQDRRGHVTDNAEYFELHLCVSCAIALRNELNISSSEKAGAK